MDPTLTFKFGIDTVLSCERSLGLLKRSRFALVAHPASVTTSLVHTLDALATVGALPHCVFGPQHGARGDKQDNMIETEDFVDPLYDIPVYSLYGANRRPTEAMLRDVDLIIFDLQDVGCRVYTFLTTLHYLLEASGEYQIPIWVLDRPNPAGRQIDGLALEYGEESFVGTAAIPMAHGLTLGEIAGWLNETFNIGASLTIKKMEGYELASWRQSAWPLSQPWVNPSPNASNVNMTRHFPGTVLLEGTILSEGRGTTTPLELVGAPWLDVEGLVQTLKADGGFALGGTLLRPCFFEPTFHKHAGTLCAGIQFHTEHPGYRPEGHLPYTLMAIALRSIQGQLDSSIWRSHEYEYERNRLPIDVITGGSRFREWVDNPNASIDSLCSWIEEDRSTWFRARENYCLYQTPQLEPLVIGPHR